MIEQVKNKTKKVCLIAACILFSWGTSFEQSAAPVAYPSSSTPSGLNEISRSDSVKLLLVADNQEHLLTGGRLRSMDRASEKWLTSVAIRSPLANVGGKALLAEILQFGIQDGASIVLHLGDAADISCPDELSATFKVLNKEAGERWFMVPGNHDGFLAGNFAKLQRSADDKVVDIFTKPLNDGHAGEKTWLNACLSPTNMGDPSKSSVMTKGDAIKEYVARLKQRSGLVVDEIKQIIVPLKAGIKRRVEVPCDVESIRIPSLGYSAIARICTHPAGSPKWVGPYASFIVQRLDVNGTTIGLLDTSTYKNPALPRVAFRGQLSSDQRDEANKLFRGVQRANLILAGHHPFGDMKEDDRDDQKWIAEKAGRYMSGHKHDSAKTFKRPAGTNNVNELNIGSTLDFPPQAVAATIDATGFRFRVMGAPSNETAWAAFLEPCEAMQSVWRLAPAVYKNYTDGLYVVRVLDALRQAAEVYNRKFPNENRLQVPTGDAVGDWRLFDQLLTYISELKGAPRKFWACQAYYASEATQLEEGKVQRALRKLNLDRAKGTDATGYEEPTFREWRRFVSPE